MMTRLTLIVATVVLLAASAPGAEGAGERQRYPEQGGQQRQNPSIRQPRETIGLTPLTEIGDANYKGESGGLYGEGRNEPPVLHRDAAKKALAEIQPLDFEGHESKTGKIGFISLGMSNTTQEFSCFKQMADRDANKSPCVIIVDCAQGGQAAGNWANPEKYVTGQGQSPWDVMDERIRKAGLTAAQVQVVWIKQALPGPARIGEFPRHARAMQSDLAVIVQKLRQKFANLRFAYLSSRIYAGYATVELNPEPYAYESAFAVRWLIEDQIRGATGLNFDPGRGEVKAPLLLWGPYLWADGLNGRRSDGLVWKREDLTERDGTHPSESGRQKVAEILLRFFKSDPSAGTWFVKN